MVAQSKHGKYLQMAHPTAQRLSLMDESLRHGELTPQHQKIVDNTRTGLLVADGTALIVGHTIARTQQVLRFAAQEQADTRATYDRIRQQPLSVQGKQDVDEFLTDLDILGGNIVNSIIADFGESMRANARRDIYAKAQQPRIVSQDETVEVGFRDALRGHKTVRTQRVVYDE